MTDTPKKILVIGSGPIVIGQAAEFDYAGTQACKSLREEGVETILVNSNPATIMTDEDVADSVYIEPLTVPVISRIIEREQPDALLPTLGGQTGLNLAVELVEAGVLEQYGVRLLGSSVDSIKKADYRLAAHRNVIKRRVKNSFMRQASKLPALDFVVLVKAGEQVKTRDSLEVLWKDMEGLDDE